MMRGAVAALLAAVAGAATAGKAIDVWCDMLSSIDGQFTGRKEDMAALMAKFSGMMANKIDCSVDPNNKILGFNLKGVSYAECVAASLKQQQAQSEMIGFSKGSKMRCTEKIVDEEANTAAAWVQMDGWVGGHHMRSRIAARFNMDGDKVAGYHMIFDTYQIFALKELLDKERAEKALPEIALASRPSSAGHAVDAMCETFFELGHVKVGGKDQQAWMAKFEGLFAEKFDISEDPNNAMLGFNLKGVSWAQLTEAKTKQLQAQARMLGGMQTTWAMTCIHKIVDADTNSAAVWFNSVQEDYQGNHLFNTRWALRINMEGDKIAACHSVYDTFQLVALSEKLARQREQKALPEIVLASPSSAGRAVDAMCETFNALGRPQASGGKDLEVTMAKFEGLFAEKFDVSEDPNNAMLGFDLKGVSFAEFTAAKTKQLQAQGHMLGGMQTKWTMTCFHKIVDADTNNAAVWLNNVQEDPQGNHLFNTRWAMRINMEGDKIAGLHTVYDTFQLVALSEKMSRAVTLSANASSLAGVGAIACLGAAALVIAVVKKKEQKSYTLLADATSA